MEYFGRNLFVMNILPTSTSRKPLIAGNLRPGKGGTPPGTKMREESEGAEKRT
jgi:hypothetical protein